MHAHMYPELSYMACKSKPTGLSAVRPDTLQGNKSFFKGDLSSQRHRSGPNHQDIPVNYQGEKFVCGAYATGTAMS